MSDAPDLPGYRLENVLHRGSDTLVYAGFRARDERAVIVKLAAAEFPAPRIIARLRREYELARELREAGVVRALALEKYGRGTALILEDFGGRALSESLKEGGLPLERFLDLAARLSSMLGEIHARNVIHKDIKPANIIIKGETVKIADLGIASRLNREEESGRHLAGLEGTLAYMSPEQTGRMNRSIDYRSDFYSLGATFYEMLTGAPPFSAEDPMEMVHRHIARNPPSPETKRPDVPFAVSAIVMKLLAKTAEDRYQSIHGLRSDLEKCLREYREKGRIEMTSIGEVDRSEQFRVPQKLYGREREATRLLDAFARTAEGAAELLMVSGFSGIGKTALVKEVEKPLVESRGYFAGGKFDQFKRNIPYGAVIEAVRGLVREILTERDEVVRDWSDRLNRAFGGNGRVITDVIPEVALITGEQAPVPALGPAEAQNRLMLMFQVFIRVLARPEHPLAIFLDDLQWADEATLKLIRFLLSDQGSGHLLIIGAYRDNEVDAHHPMMLMLNELKHENRLVNEIRLGPLLKGHVQALVGDTFSCEDAPTAELTELVVKQTRGNPFFINEFLKSLVEQEGITFNRSTGQWSWEIAKLENLGLSDNVVEFMAARIRRLPEAPRELLCFGACIGAVFDLKTVAVLAGGSLQQAARHAMIALEEGLIVPRGESYRFISSAEEREIDPAVLETQAYKFLHDRVQQAAYSLLPEEKRKRIHREIGEILSRGEDSDERIFDIVGHLNQAPELLQDQAARGRLAELNFTAGTKARESSAFRPALDYFRRARALMTDDIWASDYELAFELYRESFRIEAMVGREQEAETLFEIAMHHARNRVDKASIFKIKQVLLFDQNEYRESILTGLKGLRMFGIRLPEKPSQARVLAELARLPLNLGRREIGDMVDAEELRDPEIIAAMGLIQELLPCGYLTNPDLLVLGSLRLANISLRHGVSPISAYGFGVTGLVVNAALFAYETGNKFNGLSLALLDRFADRVETGPLIGPTCMVSACFTSWPVEKINNPVLQARRGRAIEKCIDFGIFNYACYTLTLTFAVRFLRGDSLGDILADLEQYEQFIVQSGDDDARDLFMLNKQFIRNLRGETTDRFSLSEPDGDFSDAEYIRVAHERSYHTGIYSYQAFKCIIHYTRGDYQAALQWGLRAEEWTDGALSNALLTMHAFYTALAVLALWRSTGVGRRKLLRVFRSRRKRIARKWHRVNPVSFAQLLFLLDAEEARCLGHASLAMENYRRAIVHCREHGYTNYLGLAQELMGAFFLELGHESIARVYLEEARETCVRWGAPAKAEELRARLPAHGEDTSRGLSNTQFSNTQLSDENRDFVSGGAVAELGEYLRRIVEAEAALNRRKVRFEFQDETTGVWPAEVREGLGEALLELVRNAVVHGVESPEERAARNKPSTGHVRITCASEQGRLSVVCEDDGSGLKTAAISERAATVGLPAGDEPYKLIFTPGFSTLPGRSAGVGLTRVRNAVKAMNAKLALRTEAGRYTRFTIQFSVGESETH